MEILLNLISIPLSMIAFGTILHLLYRNKKEKPSLGIDQIPNDYYKNNFNIRFFIYTKGFIFGGIVILILSLLSYFNVI